MENFILASRRQRRLRLEDLGRLSVSLRKVQPFIVTIDWRPVLLTDRADLKSIVAPASAAAEQLELFVA